MKERDLTFEDCQKIAKSLIGADTTEWDKILEDKMKQEEIIAKRITMFNAKRYGVEISYDMALDLANFLYGYGIRDIASVNQQIANNNADLLAENERLKKQLAYK